MDGRTMLMLPTRRMGSKGLDAPTDTSGEAEALVAAQEGLEAHFEGFSSWGGLLSFISCFLALIGQPLARHRRRVRLSVGFFVSCPWSSAGLFRSSAVASAGIFRSSTVASAGLFWSGFCGSLSIFSLGFCPSLALPAALWIHELHDTVQHFERWVHHEVLNLR